MLASPAGTLSVSSMNLIFQKKASCDRTTQPGLVS